MAGPSGTVTFLFTDIEGSTRLWQENEEAMRSALSRHDELLRRAVAEHGGTVFSTMGDGLAAAFGSAVEAVAAARAAQQLIDAERWPTATPIRVRMGLHTGEAELRDGDYFGTAVNRTARLMAIGHGGQVLCSPATAALVEGEFAVVDLGEHRLRDLSAPLRVLQVGEGRFEPLRSLDAVPGNLPVVLTDLVGRSDDVARILKVVENERLVTLTGVGGIGKTRLSLAVAAAMAPSFADGCWFAELAPAGSENEVIQAVAAAMGAPVNDRASLARYVSDRQVLVVLDNCEHVLGPAADLAQALLESGPDVVIVATSREPLGLDGEVVRGVASLGTPEDDVDAVDALKSSAVRLFVARASAATEQFTLDEDNVGDVAAICRRLDGIPLAIELAAARVRAMGPAQIARRLDERFRLLGAGRGTQERHRTLQATVSWSHDLLSDEERAVFRRLAVFPGSFDLEAAERVAEGIDPLDVIDVVVHLVERSLVQYDGTTDRYRLLETLRQYAADRLAEAGETMDAREAHSNYFGDLVERYAAHLEDARYGLAVARLLPELDNLRAAAVFLVETGRFDDLLRLGHRAVVLVTQYAPADGIRWLGQAVEGRGTTADQELVDALGDLAYLTVILGDVGSSFQVADRSLRVAEDRELQASPSAWSAKALGAGVTVDPKGSLDAARAGLAVASARGDQLSASLLAALVTQALAALGDFEASQAAADDSLAMARGTGSAIAIGVAVVCVLSARLYSSDTPDFASALDIIEQQARRHGLAEDNTVGLWLALYRAMALVGAQPGTAVPLLARCLRNADRLQIFPAAEWALRLLALEAARAGRTETAGLLLGYCTANHAAYEIHRSDHVWLDKEIKEALSAVSPDDRARHAAEGEALGRRELMSLVAGLERSMDQPGSSRSP